MFFPERIRSIGPSDRVLDIGPGGFPHPRAGVFLEKRFADDASAHGQRGHVANAADPGRTVYYDGGRFPFKDGEFDYVVCSHVLEHVDDVEGFVAEIQRVGRAGYLEFPTIYYDYLYDFPEHVTFLLHRDGVIHWMPKADLRLAEFKPVTALFHESLRRGHMALIDALKVHFFQGFEWSRRVELRRARSLEELTFDPATLAIAPPASPSRRGPIRRALGRVGRRLGM